MTPHSDSRRALDHLEGALESACAALMVVQGMRIRLPDEAVEIRDVELQLLRACAEIRQGIVEISVPSGPTVSLFAFGFVLEASPTSATADDDPGQVRPRRTA